MTRLSDETFMRRALLLAAKSPADSHPNPMVGAVIVTDGKIISEGWHRKCGQGHAEVNAIASVTDRSLLRRSTIYVSLEPCSHYGKTPPCARLIIESGIPRVVVGAVDPFEKVAGRGIAMLREAGIEVSEGILADECRALNVKFYTAHTLRRPYITLKWATSADGFMDTRRIPGESAPKFSSQITSTLAHRLRTLYDGILTTSRTAISDGCRLSARLFEGPSPQRIVVDRGSILPEDAPVFSNTEKPVLLYSPHGINISDPCAMFSDLYAGGITSVLIEAGPTYLRQLIGLGLYDSVRIERNDAMTLGADGAAPAPQLPDSLSHISTQTYGPNTVSWYSRNPESPLLTLHP